MKFVSYQSPGRDSPGLGLLVNEAWVLDLHEASDGALPSDLRRLLLQGPEAMAAARALLKQAEQNGDGQKGSVGDLSSLRLLPPISNPGKLMCVALNFQSHIDECQAYGMDFIKRTSFPLISPKMPNTLAGHGADIVLPEGGEQLDYEVELAFVVSKQCRNVNAKDWRDYVAGFTVSVDLCLREIAFQPFGVFEGKNYDGFLPLGPYLITPDEAPDPEHMHLALSVNGEQRQSESMGQAFFGVGAVLEYWSARMSLEAGDVFTLGTPAGVGIFHADPSAALLQPGDVIEADIKGVGVLRNQIVSANKQVRDI